MSDIFCEKCGDSGYVRCHSPEDYGVSFESATCEACRLGRALIAHDAANDELVAAEREIAFMRRKEPSS